MAVKSVGGKVMAMGLTCIQQSFLWKGVLGEHLTFISWQYSALLSVKVLKMVVICTLANPFSSAFKRAFLWE